MQYSFACPDWEARLRAGRAPIPDMPLYTERGARAVRAYNMLRLADVSGTPTLEEAGGEWFRVLVAVLFGSLDPVTKVRAIREVFALVPKKNSKTTNGALLMLVALLLNERPRADFFMCAPVQDTAELAFSAVSGAIQLDPVLDRKFHIRDHLKTIVHRETKAQLEIMTFDPAVVTGRKVSGGALIDEVHEIAKSPRAAKALRQLRGGMLPFPEAFLFMITTQSDGVPQGIFKDELEKARDIRDGKRTGAMLPALYEFSTEMQTSRDKPWADPKYWPMVMPAAGVIFTVDRLFEEFEVAKATSEAELRSWASQHLNVEIGLALHADSWAGAEFWEQCGDPALTFDELLKRSEVCTVGVDGGGLDDLLGLTVIGRERGTGKWLWWSHAWAHPIVLQRRKDIAPKLRDLEAVKDLTFVEKVGDDVIEVVSYVVRINDAGLLPEKEGIGLDSYGIGSILDGLEAADIPEGCAVAVSQGGKLHSAIQTVERALAGKKIIHAAQLLMAWCVGNAKVELKGNAAMITKAASGSAKIDPLMSGFNAGYLMSVNPVAKRSFCDS
jgi:phage terminase large subunit-like protein